MSDPGVLKFWGRNISLTGIYMYKNCFAIWGGGGGASIIRPGPFFELKSWGGGGGSSNTESRDTKDTGLENLIIEQTYRYVQ